MDLRGSLLKSNRLPKSSTHKQSLAWTTTTNAINKAGDILWIVNMWIACPPKDMRCPWVGWGGVTSNQRPPCGYIQTPLPCPPHSILAPVGLRLLNNHCHSETKVSWRAHIVDLCSRIVLYCTTSTYICHMYIHSPFHTWYHNPLWPLWLLKIWDSVLN